MKLPEKLRLLRELKGETQEKVARDLKIGITTLRNYESDTAERMPSTPQLKQLKEYYNVSYEYLLDDECLNQTQETIDIGKELMLSEKAIKKIKGLQLLEISTYNKDLKRPVIQKIKTPEYSKAFNTFIESFEKFDLLNQSYSRLLNSLLLYEKVTSFLYLTYMDCLIIYYSENDKKKLKELFSYYDKLIKEIRALQVDTNINFIAYENFIDDYKNFKKDSLSRKYLDENRSFFCSRYNLTESIIEYESSINTELGFYKYQINEIITDYLSRLTEKYQVDYDNIVNNCWNDEIKKHLNFYNYIKNKFKESYKNKAEKDVKKTISSIEFMDWIINQKVDKENINSEESKK